MASGSGRSYTLVVEDRFGAVTDEYTFEAGEIIIGRSRQCDIVLPSENVSRRHARLYTTRDGLFVEDLNSANGVLVNGRRILKPEELTDNSTARLGDYQLHVRGARKAEEEKPVHLRLVGRNLSVTDQVFEITGTRTLVGRGKDCGLVLVDPSVSRVHSKIVVRPDGTVMVEDLGSANGVAVNERLVKAWDLHEGDKLRLGNLEFLVEIPNANTVETPKVQEGLLYRIAQVLSANLPWVVAVVCVLTVLALLVVFVPDYVRRAGTSTDKPPVTERPLPVPAAPGPGPAPAPAPVPAAPERPNVGASIARAKDLLNKGNLDEASRIVATVLSEDPTNEDAARLASRIGVESEDRKLLTEAETAMGQKDHIRAAQLLLQVRTESVFFGIVKDHLRDVAQRLEEQQKKACRRADSMDCYRVKALLTKVERVVK